MTSAGGFNKREGTTKHMVPFRTLIVVFLLAAGIAWSPAQCETSAGMNHHEVKLQRHRAHVIETSEPIKKVSVADPDIADIKVIAPSCLVIEGRRVGGTTCLVWYEDEGGEIFDVKVGHGMEVEAILGTALTPDKSLWGW